MFALKIAIFLQEWLTFFIFIILVAGRGGVCDGKNIATANKHNMDVEIPAMRSTHFNFFPLNLRGRQGDLSCGKDPSVCLDREKRNPWGGRTCCFQRFCKDTRSDPNHCGGCGKTCAFGLTCCDGNCVDTQSDPHHCGACFDVCPGQTKCAYAMCDYSG